MNKNKIRYVVSRYNEKTGNIHHTSKVTSKTRVDALRKYFYKTLYKYYSYINCMKDMELYDEEFLSKQLREDYIISEIGSEPESFIIKHSVLDDNIYIIPEEMKKEFVELNLAYASKYSELNHNEQNKISKKFYKLFGKYAYNSVYDIRFKGKFEAI